jgi:hypothetical protein
MKRLITLLAILSLILVAACGKAPQENSAAATINHGILEDLGKTLGELSEKHGGVAKVTEPWNGENLVYFANTPVKFYFVLQQKHSYIAAFSDEDLAKTTSSLSATVADIFPDLKEPVSSLDFIKMHNLGAANGIVEDGLPYTTIAYYEYFMTISTIESSVINPEDTIVVKIPSNETSNESSDPIPVSAATPTINDSAFEDLGKPLGELIDKYGKVTEISDGMHGTLWLHFQNTPCIFVFDHPDLADKQTTFTEDELKIESFISFYSTISDIFPDVKSEITYKDLGNMYKIDASLEEGDGYAILIQHNKYYIWISTNELGIVFPEQTLFVKNQF